MGTHPEISEALAEWVSKQPVFFVASAPLADGHVNLSPKGLDTFRVLGPMHVAYLDLTGSGAETIAHVQQNGRITLMWCSFGEDMRIVRFYGTATAVGLDEARVSGLLAHFPELPGARCIIDVSVDRVASSCGFGLPIFVGEPQERSTLIDWAEKKGPDGLATYQRTKNAVSIDGLTAFQP